MPASVARENEGRDKHFTLPVDTKLLFKRKKREKEGQKQLFYLQHFQENKTEKFLT